MSSAEPPGAGGGWPPPQEAQLYAGWAPPPDQQPALYPPVPYPSGTYPGPDPPGPYPPSQAPPSQAPPSQYASGPQAVQPHRPSRVAYVFAVIMPILLVAFMAAPFGLVVALRGWPLRASGSTTPPATNPNASQGADGLGDPYYPQAGNSGYDVTKYQIAINWDPTTETLTGTTTISAVATHRLESFFYDLVLQTDKVSVDGAPAEFEAKGFSDVYVRPAAPIASGSPFSVTVTYSGKPGDKRQGNTAPWWAGNGEWTAAGEPESSTWWYPGNDHPSDPALMDVSIRVPAGMEAISVGRLEAADSADEKDFDTWHWISRQPMATFLNFVSIGQYEIKQGVDQGLPYVYAVSEKLSPGDRKSAFAAMMTSGVRVRTMEEMFGPYPFTEVGGVVPVHQLWFGGLETQTRPVYEARSIRDADFAPGLVTHELAHMWFGDNVTLRQWNDIFNSEAYASWAQWGYEERTGGRSANDAMNAAYDRLKDNPGFWQITMIDPGRDHLFDAVYSRGPMALQALRNVIGDDAFFRLSRDWAQTPGSRTLEDWMAAAQRSTTVDLGPFFEAWIYARTAPERTAANGFR